MGESATSDSWVQAWIAQQREWLEQSLKGAAGTSEAANDNGSDQPWAEHWSQLGSTYLSGMLQMLRNGASAGAPGAETNFARAGETLDAWRSAWVNSLAQTSAPGGWVDLLNRAPPLGLFRERTEAWRALVAAQADCQRLEQELAAVMRRVQAEALQLLESRVKERAASDSPIEGFRDLYDLWVECSEQVFNTVAHSSAYSHLQGELSNAAMRLRARMQKVIEQGLRQFDLPTRSEINSVHQQLRSLKLRIVELEQALPRKAAGKSREEKPVRKPRARVAAKPRTGATPKTRSGSGSRGDSR